MIEKEFRLLDADEPAAVEFLPAQRASPYLIVCDHAGSRIPRRLGTLGLTDAELRRHIAWDIGAAGVARGLARRLRAALILQTYSRLVIDCNRPPEVSSSIATMSEATTIPGNVGIAEADAAARRHAVFEPYHARIAAELDARRDVGPAPILVAVHSFTPEYLGVKRPWQAGVLYNRDDRMARIVGAALRAHGLTVGDNQPYAVSDISDYTIPVHAERRGIPYLELEIRQDLIETAAGQAEWAARMAAILERAAVSLPASA